MAKSIYKIDDKVRIEFEGDEYHKRSGIVVNIIEFDEWPVKVLMEIDSYHKNFGPAAFHDKHLVLLPK